MRPRIWRPPIDPTPTEQVVIKASRGPSCLRFCARGATRSLPRISRKNWGRSTAKALWVSLRFPQRNWLGHHTAGLHGRLG